MPAEEENKTMFLVRSGPAAAGIARVLADRAARTLEPPPEDPPLRNAILVVDDSRTLRKILVQSLIEQGHRNLTEAADGCEALALMRAHEFDLVLLDIEMPHLSGTEVLQTMKSDPVLRGLPVIVISGSDHEEGAVQCIEMGAEDFLHKPYNPVLLRARISSSLEKKRLRDLDRKRLAELDFEKQMLQIEQEKSERLLLNILPKPTAERLKAGERTIADHYDSVTVLFTDLVGFTHWASGKQPGEVVTLLNQIVSAIDVLAEQHGLEKIKTIGDSYMLVGGLPLQRADHAAAVADIALEMITAIQMINWENGTQFAIRIGIHTGPVVAGVIGKRKFTYDLWGATVNLASRMESSSVPGQVHVSESTCQALHENFDFTERGPIECKGIGSVNTYFLIGRKGRTNG